MGTEDAEQTVEGFVHWADKSLNSDYRSIVFAMARVWHKYNPHYITASQIKKGKYALTKRKSKPPNG